MNTDRGAFAGLILAVAAPMRRQMNNWQASAKMPVCGPMRQDNNRTNGGTP